MGVAIVMRDAAMYAGCGSGRLVRVVVAGELPREAHDAPLHRFSAAPELVLFGGSTYRQRSEDTSRLLGQLFGRLRGEGSAVAYTMRDFRRDYIKEHLPELPPEGIQDVLRGVPPEQIRATPSAEQIRADPDRKAAGDTTRSRPSRRKTSRPAGRLARFLPFPRPDFSIP